MKFTETDNTLHCFFSGRLDGQVCSTIEPVLYERVTKFIENRDTVMLVFNLAEVIYASSAFLRLCLIHCKLIGKPRFLIEHTSGEVYKVFHISGFTEIINIRSTPTETE